MSQNRGGADFAPPEITRALEDNERRRAIVICAQHARGTDELRMFLQMLGLVDELV